MVNLRPAPTESTRPVKTDAERAATAPSRQEVHGKVFCEGWRGLLLAVSGLALVAAIAGLDRLTGPDLSFGIFYLLPIALCAWWGGFAQGILIAMACAVSWQLVDTAEGAASAPIIILWNGITRFGIFVITSSLLSRLRISLFLEKRMARSDPLTGAANGRTFYETVSHAVERAHRDSQQLTLAYLDLDQFKWINDTLGHSAGDEVLCRVVNVIQDNIRAEDQLARLGGDEFALLLSCCDGREAFDVLERIRARFAEEMQAKQWPVTVSIGGVTFRNPTRDIDTMVHQVDELMYRAKKAGKNQVVHEYLDASDTDNCKPLERRAAARVLCDRLARVVAKDEAESVDEYARVRDLSSTGLCLHLERELPRDTLLAIEPLHECGAVTLIARVLWSIEDNGGWLHECVLPNRLSADEMRFWIEEHAAESHPRGSASRG